MPTYSRILLSSSVSGRPIPVVAVATPGTLIHTAVAGATDFDEVYLWADNVTGTAATLTIEWGGATTGDQAPAALIIPPNSSAVVKVGQVLNGGLDVRAFSDTASAINCTGFCNRIEQ